MAICAFWKGSCVDCTAGNVLTVLCSVVLCCRRCVVLYCLQRASTGQVTLAVQPPAAPTLMPSLTSWMTNVDDSSACLSLGDSCA
jgi:hypothetical protein